MKFLKKDFTEAGYVLGVVQHAALSHPEIAFTLIRDGKQVFSTDGKGKLITPVFAVFGKEMTANMIEVPENEHNGLTVHGYIVKPHAGRANRSMQHFSSTDAMSKAGSCRRRLKRRIEMPSLRENTRPAQFFWSFRCRQLMSMCIRQRRKSSFHRKNRCSRRSTLPARTALAANDNTPQLEHKEKHTPREDNLTQEQQRFAVPRSEPAPTARSFAQPVQTQPVSKEEEAELEDFSGIRTAAYCTSGLYVCAAAREL